MCPNIQRDGKETFANQSFSLILHSRIFPGVCWQIMDVHFCYLSCALYSFKETEAILKKIIIQYSTIREVILPGVALTS